MMKQAALWIAIIKLPIYVAQKDAEGGLAWDQTTKGILFFIWVLFQNVSASSFGIFADKFSKKQLLYVSHFFMISGYTLIAFSRETYSLFCAIILLGIGSGIFKPILEGSVAGELKGKDTAKGWSLYIIAVNLGVIFSTFLMDYLDNYSWTLVFLGSGFILLLDLVFLVLLPKEKIPENINVLSNLKKVISKKQLWQITFAMIGFTTIYMQFYEMLPNFIFDWVDSSFMAKEMKYFSANYPMGKMIDIKWYYQIMSILIIIIIIPVNSLLRNTSIYKSLVFGMIFVTFGWLISGLTNSSNFLLVGMIIYTVGEMIVRPKFYEFATKLSEKSNRILHMSIVNLAYALGYMIGALSGGWIYQYFGEKARFIEIFNIDNSIARDNNLELSYILWEEYNPSLAFYPYFILGLISIIYLLVISRKSN